jgi:hypothetical protein
MTCHARARSHFRIGFLLSQHCAAGHDKSCPYVEIWKFPPHKKPSPLGKVAPKATKEDAAPGRNFQAVSGENVQAKYLPWGGGGAEGDG